MGYLHLPMSCCSVVVGARGRRARGDGETGPRSMGTELGNALASLPPNMLRKSPRRTLCTQLQGVGRLHQCTYNNSCKRFLRPNDRASVGRPMAFHFFCDDSSVNPRLFLRMWSADSLLQGIRLIAEKLRKNQTDAADGRTTVWQGDERCGMPRRGVYSTTGTKPQVGMYRHGSIQDTAMRSKGGLCGLVSYETSGVFLTPTSLPFFYPDVTFLIVRLPPPLSWKSRPFQSPKNFAHLSPPHNRSPDCINHGSTPSNREEEKDRPCERRMGSQNGRDRRWAEGTPFILRRGTLYYVLRTYCMRCVVDRAQCEFFLRRCQCGRMGD